MAYTSHNRQTTYTTIDAKNLTNIDLAPLSPTKSSNTTEYAAFRNDRVLSVQDRRSRGQNVQPLGTGIRKSIFGLRRALLVVRALQLVGAGGLLACLCLLGNIPSIQSYIVRAPVSEICSKGVADGDKADLTMTGRRLAPILRLRLMQSTILRDHRNIGHLRRRQRITSLHSSSTPDLFLFTSSKRL